MENIKNIFLIDDDTMFNFINKNVICRAQIFSQISLFTDAEKALASLKEFFVSEQTKSHSLIFLDINMPNMDGWEFLDEFNNIDSELRKNCCIVMLSSSIDPSDIEKSREYSTVYDFISKPLTIEKLNQLKINLAVNLVK